MTDFYTQVTMEHDSALPEDRSVNVWSADISAVNEATGLAAWHTALETFYASIDSLLSSSFSGLMTIKSYRRSDAQPRVPILTTPPTLVPGAGQLPSEVAFVVSFQGVRIAGGNQARRRGRIYLGPLTSTAADTATGRPAAATISTVATAADVLVTSSKAAADWEWSVWSTVNLDGTNVDNGWVDNAWDTQRRRGISPTARTLFS